MVGRRLEKKQIILATLQLKLIDNPYYILLITYHQSSIMIARNNYLSFIIDYSSLIKESPNHGFSLSRLHPVFKSIYRSISLYNVQ